MTKKLLTSIMAFVLCLTTFATDMVVKQKNGKILRFNVTELEEVAFEESIPEDATVVDASETFLQFNILSDSTVEVKKDNGDNEPSYPGHDTIIVPAKVRIDGTIYTVTSIGESAFAYSVDLRCVKLPEGVTNIGSYAFYHSNLLTSIDIPESVTIIGEFAFYYCNRLEPKLLIYDNGTKCYGWIGDSKKCKDVVIPEKVTDIGAGAFYYCSDLTSIEIPEGVTRIGANAFVSCGLTNINIPASVTSIGDFAFILCPELNIIIDNSKDNVNVGDSVFKGCKSVKWLKE